MKILFKPEIKTLGQFEPNKRYTFEDLSNETMFFSCTPDFIYDSPERAPITRAILDRLFARIINLGLIDPDLEDLQFIIDTRVNMLMAGQYPSIPGWHCDDLKRGENGQPDFSLTDKDVKHFMVLISDTDNPANCISGTEFVTNETLYDINPDKVWQSLHEAVELDSSKHTSFVRERDITMFNQGAIHRASPAVRNGWRYFFRLSYTHRKPSNSIRRQVQTYVDVNNAGW